MPNNKIPPYHPGDLVIITGIMGSQVFYLGDMCKLLDFNRDYRSWQANFNNLGNQAIEGTGCWFVGVPEEQTGWAEHYYSFRHATNQEIQERLEAVHAQNG